MTVAAEFSDEGKSGKNTTGRPRFTEMLNRIQNGNPDNVDYVLVFKLSRFGRNTADVLNNLQIMEDYGVSLLAVEDGIDSAGAAGKLMIAVLAAVAEIERENIRAQTMAGRLQKAREGRWNGGYAPYGYKLENGELFINEDEAPAVRKIFELYTQTNHGCGSIAKWLNDSGYQKIVRQRGVVGRFSERLVKNIIDNPVYFGKIAYRDTFYYLCKHRKNIDGYVCTYRPHPPQARIDAEVEALVVDALQSPAFIEAMQNRLNQTIDADEIKARIAEMEKARAQLTGAKDKLAQQMDRLDIMDKNYDAKYADMQARLDSFYDQIAETDANIQKERNSLTKLFQGQASLENAIQMLRLVQDKFGSMPDAVKKSVYLEIIDSVEIFEKPRPDGRQVKCVHFKFPVTVDGETDKDWWYPGDDDEDGGEDDRPGSGPSSGPGGPDTGGGPGGGLALDSSENGSYKETSDFRDRDLSRRW